MVNYRVLLFILILGATIGILLLYAARVLGESRNPGIAPSFLTELGETILIASIASATIELLYLQFIENITQEHLFKLYLPSQIRDSFFKNISLEPFVYEENVVTVSVVETRDDNGKKLVLKRDVYIRARNRSAARQVFVFMPNYWSAFGESSSDFSFGNYITVNHDQVITIQQDEPNAVGSTDEIPCRPLENGKNLRLYRVGNYLYLPYARYVEGDEMIELACSTTSQIDINDGWSEITKRCCKDFYCTVLYPSTLILDTSPRSASEFYKEFGEGESYDLKGRSNVQAKEAEAKLKDRLPTGTVIKRKTCHLSQLLPYNGLELEFSEAREQGTIDTKNPGKHKDPQAPPQAPKASAPATAAT